MPRFINLDPNDDKMQAMPAGTTDYHFSAIRPERLGAAEYTLATINLDFSGSTSSFKVQLEDMLKTTLDALKRSPRANNLLVRVIIFSSSFQGGTQELHGFKPLNDIDANNYNLPEPRGCTPLVDAAFDGAAATNAFAKCLYDQEFAVNAIQISVTDGEDNASSTPRSKVKSEFQAGVNAEYLESNISILIGINAQYCEVALKEIKDDCGYDHYIDCADATPESIARVGAFISKSVSSQSQALGTGGASQSIAAVI